MEAQVGALLELLDNPPPIVFVKPELISFSFCQFVCFSCAWIELHYHEYLAVQSCWSKNHRPSCCLSVIWWPTIFTSSDLMFYVQFGRLYSDSYSVCCVSFLIFLDTLVTSWLEYFSFERCLCLAVILGQQLNISKEHWGSHSPSLWSPFSVLQYTNLLNTLQRLYIFTHESWFTLTPEARRPLSPQPRKASTVHYEVF
jgi:hypothetical protein